MGDNHGLMPWERIVEMSKNQLGMPTFLGFPVMPGQVGISLQDLIYTRAKKSELLVYLNTFKDSNGIPHKMSRLDALALQVLYAVTYISDRNDTPYQFFCYAGISRIDKDYPLRFGQGIPVDVDLPSSEVRLVTSPLHCDAN
jgi:hypothetical protein